MPLTVAIIGSGPAGFYTADALLRSGMAIEIDILDRLPTPFGLIRGGVAPDHQATKKIIKKYEKTILGEAVQFFGNVEMGRDVSIKELRAMYDAVVLAVGAPGDRKLTIPGADKNGVHGSAAFVGWYNGHPDFTNLEPNLDIETACVVGNGNVAIDVARILARSGDGRARTDLPGYARDAIDASPIRDVWLLGRRGPIDAKFTNVELREMGELTECSPRVRPEQLPDNIPDGLSDRRRRLVERNLDTLRTFAAQGDDDKPKCVHFEFFAQPLAVLGGERVEGLRVERTRVENGRAVGTGEIFDISCGMVVAAIGYRSEPLAGIPYDDARGIVPNSNGRIEKGLYAVGWIKRGPSGVISSNRPDGIIATEHIMADFDGRGEKSGRPALEAILAERGVRVVSFADWKIIEAAEETSAVGDAPRRKFTSIKEMLALLNGPQGS